MSDLPAIKEDGINEQLAEITQSLVDERDPKRAKELLDQFNWNISKKNAMRVLKLLGLFDSVSDEMVRRFAKSPDNFTSGELLDYMSTVQTAIEKSQKAMNGADEPQLIQVKQENNVNVNILDSYDRESKERVAEAIKSIIAQAASGNQIQNFAFETSFEDNSKDE